MIKSGEAEFFFVANDALEDVLIHLQTKGYKYFEQKNEICTNEQLFAMGYAWPEYIHRIYRGYNRAILESKGEIVVLVNSDHNFSPDWLENLLKYFDSQKIVCSQLIEPKHSRFGLFPSAINGEFGNTPDNFDKEGFLNFAKRVRKSGFFLGGAYMPCMFYKDISIYTGLYPEGNIAGTSFDEISMTGDEAFFDRLSKNGIVHITSRDSIVYHLKEGEKDDKVDLEVGKGKIRKDNLNIKVVDYKPLPSFQIKNYRLLIQQTMDHSQIMAQLLSTETKPLFTRKNIVLFLEKHLPSFLNSFIHLIWRIIKKLHT
jgi:hypothetical protein